MSWRESAIRWLGGVPAEDAAILAGQRDAAEARASDTERRAGSLQADYLERCALLVEARQSLVPDATRAAEARVAGELADLRRLAAERGDRYECYYSTCRVTWDAHEPVTSNVYCFFLTPIGCSGAGFSRALTPAETNVREAPPPPLAIRAVSVSVSLASPEDRPSSCRGADEAELLVARSAIRRHCVLQLALPQWREDIGPLDEFDIEGGRVRPYSPPEHVEAAMREHPRGWRVALVTGQFQLPRRVTLDIRVGLHGDLLPPPVPTRAPFLDPLGSGPPPGYFGSSEDEHLRRIVREEVTVALNNHPFHLTRP